MVISFSEQQGQHYVRMPGGIGQPHPVLSGVPQCAVLGPFTIFDYDY